MSTDTQQATNDWAAAAQEYGQEQLAQTAADGFGDELSLDASDIDAEKMGKGLKVDTVGTYHFEISGCKQQAAAETLRKERPAILVPCHVLLSVPGQSPQGAVYFHVLEFPTVADREHMVNTKNDGQVPLSVMIARSTCEFLLGIGILVKQGKQIIDPETNSPKINAATLIPRLEKQQFIGRIKDREFTYGERHEKAGQKGHEYGLHYGQGVSRVDDPQNANVPMHGDALKLIGKSRATAAPAGQTTKAGAPAANAKSQPQTTKAAASAGKPAATPATSPAKAPPANHPANPVAAAAASGGDEFDSI